MTPLVQAQLPTIAGSLPQPSAANADHLQPGRRLTHVGRYDLRQVLGEGAFGGVYEGWDPLLSRSVAVRTWQFGLKMSARIAMDRLLLGAARKACDWRHKHIVEVLDAGLSAHGIYVTMEYLKGRDLRCALAEGWCASLGEALLLARRSADALQALHARGLVHCAVEPGNLFITRSGRPKLLKAGIAASLVHAQSSHLSGIDVSDAHYLSPEHWAAGHTDALSDIYSLGVVLYEVFTGRVAFNAGSPQALRRSIVTGQRSHLAERRPDLPRSVVELVERMMDVDRDRRPSSAAEVSKRLRVLHGQFAYWSPSRAVSKPRVPRSSGQLWPLRWPFQPSML